LALIAASFSGTTHGSTEAASFCGRLKDDVRAEMLQFAWDAYAHAARFLAEADELQQPQLRLAGAGPERLAREPGR
jgi:hypothetical protein